MPAAFVQNGLLHPPNELHDRFFLELSVTLQKMPLPNLLFHLFRLGEVKLWTGEPDLVGRFQCPPLGSHVHDNASGKSGDQLLQRACRTLLPYLTSPPFQDFRTLRHVLSAEFHPEVSTERDKVRHRTVQVRSNSHGC